MKPQQILSNLANQVDTTLPTGDGILIIDETANTYHFERKQISAAQARKLNPIHIIRIQQSEGL